MATTITISVDPKDMEFIKLSRLSPSKVFRDYVQKFRLREHDPIVEAILGKDIKYVSENFKRLEKALQEAKRIIRKM